MLVNWRDWVQPTPRLLQRDIELPSPICELSCEVATPLETCGAVSRTDLTDLIVDPPRLDDSFDSQESSQGLF